MSDGPVRVLVVDDHAVVRSGLRALLSTEPGIEVVGEAADGKQAVERALELEPDVVIMDLVLPEFDGAEAMRRIREIKPGIRMLVLTSFGSDDKLFPALKAGALGYLLKDASPDELIRAIYGTAQGLSSLNQTVARRLLSELSKEQPVRAVRDALTEREIEVLRSLARGLSNEAIGDALSISEATVRTHVSNILFKMNLDNRTQAALHALREGLASLDDVPY
jgi:NarL family two-component system response regulator LiaR